MNHIPNFIFLALFCSMSSYAKAPTSDYNLKCIARNSSVQIVLKLESGIDPSGEFDTWISAKAPFTSLNGIQYAASAKYGQNRDTIFYTSASYIRPRIILYVDWSNKMPDGFYRGKLVRQNLNGGQPLGLNCSYKEQ